MLPFAIFDPHVHQWDPRNTPRQVTPLVKLFGRFPRVLDSVARTVTPGRTLEYIGSPEYVLHPYLPDVYAADIRPQPIEGLVHVQAEWMGLSALAPVGETRWVAGLPFDAAGVPLGAIVAKGDPSSRHFDRLLSAHRRASPLVRGIRMMAARHEDPGIHPWARRRHMYRDAAFLRGFERLAVHEMSFDAWVYSDDIDDVTALARRFPEVPLVLDHFGTPAGAFGPVGKHTGRTAQERDRIVGAWREAMARLAEVQHVHVKLSGLLMPVLGLGYHERPVKPGSEEIAEAIAPMVDHTLDLFGPLRCMYASNFPMDKVSADLSSIVEAYAAIVRRRGDDALHAVFHDTAERFYGLGRGSDR